MSHSVGKSSYGDLNGIVQFVASLIVAAQVASLCYEFDTQFPGARARGDRLTVNEGIRSKRRMEVLRAAWERYQRYGTPWAALAAALYLSTHRKEIGTALDFGITTKDGSNRAMTAAEAAWVHQHGPARGIVWTGRLFNPQESWHHNGGYEYTLPPIVGVNLPGEKFYTDRATAAQEKEDDDMKVIYASDKKSALFICGTGRMLLNEKSTPLGTEQLGWLDQAKLAEKACRVDQQKAWSELALNARELSLMSQLMGRLVVGA